MNKKGQSVLSEHVMLFFVVVAALVAMTTYMQRGFEARIHDAKNYMISTVNSACDADCQQATGGNVFYEYEPYYQQGIAYTQQNEVDTEAETNGSAKVIGAIYMNSVHEQANTTAASGQLPSECADGANPKPAYCASL